MGFASEPASEKSENNTTRTASLQRPSGQDVWSRHGADRTCGNTDGEVFIRLVLSCRFGACLPMVCRAIDGIPPRLAASLFFEKKLRRGCYGAPVTMDTVQLLRQLCEAVGLSGHETEVRTIVRGAFEPFCEEVREDALGNLIGLQRGDAGRAPGRIMLAAHMDEIGLIVTEIDQGFLRFGTVGGFDARTLPGREVVVHGRRPLRGVVASRPPHVLPPDAANRPLSLDDMYIDVGLPREVVQEIVRPGDLVSVRGPFTELKNEYACGKAMDDRVGVAVVALCLEMLARMRHSWDVFAVATVQEELGLRGAFTSTWHVMPDAGIAIDVGFGRQPGVAEKDAIDLDKGPGLAWGPNIHPVLFQRLKKTAADNEIPVQIEIAPRGTGTDANAIQITRAGVPAALLSVPLRNMHTPVETVCMRDIRRTARLLAVFIAGLDDAFLDALRSGDWSEQPA